MSGPGLLSDGWFREENDQWPGIAQGLKVEKVLYDKKGPFQHLTVFESDPKGPWGTVMTLDGAIQFTDYDEFVYHEQLANLSCCSHPKPERVLVVGGGDGGVVRELLRHKDSEKGILQRVDQVDIDGAVIEQSKIHFPQIACSYADPIVHSTVGDGVAYVKEAADNTYDVIIIDSSDPDGPASELFGIDFFKNVMRILKPGGIVCNQGESIWLHRPLIERMIKFLKEEVGFATVKYAMIYIPTYPGGSIGTLVCAKEKDTKLTEPCRPVEALPFAKDLKYYSTDMHKASYVLPRFAAHLNE
uniref:Spermidine synthase n=1 Tax=Herpetomonas muscarum TaxID=5718 RepID=U5KMT7_HERMU|nr:spermidine synthase [Herpetomonas muscarum]